MYHFSAFLPRTNAVSIHVCESAFLSMIHLCIHPPNWLTPPRSSLWDGISMQEVRKSSRFTHIGDVTKQNWAAPETGLWGSPSKSTSLLHRASEARMVLQSYAELHEGARFLKSQYQLIFGCRLPLRRRHGLGQGNLF